MVAIASFKEDFVGLPAFDFVDFLKGENFVAESIDELLFQIFGEVGNLAVAANFI